ncbi:MAG: RIP metalloprotease RseP [Flavobacteriaceae bacterium]|nr:RIP metalloprotease RseP [Flavobacteriaceae bacterium]
MNDFIIKAIQLILSLSILIVLHELGHFIPAKIFKTRVEKFYLFFDVKFSLFKKKIGETVYGIGWLPLGGYVKISGMIDESMDKEQMAQPPQPWEFRSKPAWQRLIIMVGGVTVNLLLGILIYILILFTWGSDYSTKDDVKYGFEITSETLEKLGFQDGDKIVSIDGKIPDDVMRINGLLFLRSPKTVTVEHTSGNTETIQLPDDLGEQLFKSGELSAFVPRMPIQFDSITTDSPAEKAGLLVTDKILSVNKQKVSFWDEVKTQIKESSANDEDIVFTVLRNRDTLQLAIKPDANGKIGVGNLLDMSVIERNHKTYGLAESIPAGISFGINTLKDYVGQFKYIFTKKGASELGGFGAIGNMFPPRWDWQAFWMSTAFISIILAFMNILPIPALDGGHVVFLLYEMVSGRKPNEKVLEYAQVVGFVLLISLVLYANGNDIYRAFFQK